MNILFNFPHGLGDVVQFSIVLAHLSDHFYDVKTLPSWQNYFPLRLKEYDQEKRILFSPGDPELSRDYPTKTTRCLIKELGVLPDQEKFTYQSPIFMPLEPREPYVLIHGRGVSCPKRKNLTDAEILNLANHVKNQGYTPLLLDFSGLMTHLNIELPLQKPSLEYVAGLILGCDRMIGIDSGPEHLACALNKKVDIIWKDYLPFTNIEPHSCLTNWICAQSLLNWQESYAIPDEWWTKYHVKFYQEIGEICPEY